MLIYVYSDNVFGHSWRYFRWNLSGFSIGMGLQLAFIWLGKVRFLSKWCLVGVVWISCWWYICVGYRCLWKYLKMFWMKLWGFLNWNGVRKCRENKLPTMGLIGWVLIFHVVVELLLLWRVIFGEVNWSTVGWKLICGNSN